MKTKNDPRGGGDTKRRIPIHASIRKSANLMLSHGGTAVIVPAARVHCPDTASRIIRKLWVSEDEFYADIFEAERTYVQTLRFWD